VSRQPPLAKTVPVCIIGSHFYYIPSQVQCRQGSLQYFYTTYCMHTAVPCLEAVAEGETPFPLTANSITQPAALFTKWLHVSQHGLHPPFKLYYWITNGVGPYH
jgi:hypothetical protein